MSKIIISIILLIVSISLFFGFIDPVYKETQSLNIKKGDLNKALNNFKEIKLSRDVLLEKSNNISRVDLARLKRLAPNHVDNVRLVMELDGIASRYGMSLKNVKMKSEATKENGVLGANNVNYGTFNLDFSVIGSYSVFTSFLRDLEKSLRIVDVTSIAVISRDNGFYEYNIGIQTYWLK